MARPRRRGRTGILGRQGGTGERLPNSAASFRSRPCRVTAVPFGTQWRVKLIRGEATGRLGRFDSRLEALGAAVLFAARVGGTVIP
jgi:hypothetical protein